MTKKETTNIIMNKMNKEMSTAFGCLMSLTMDIQDIIDRLKKYGIKSYNEINDENEVYKYLVYDERTKKNYIKCLLKKTNLCIAMK